MTYKLKLLPEAMKEWGKLNYEIKEQFKKQLKKILVHPRVTKDKLRGDLKYYYKIKLRSVCYRLVYCVVDDDLSLVIIAVGKKNKADVYLKAIQRSLKKS
jgi:mRNA interferase RelE/StbE